MKEIPGSRKFLFAAITLGFVSLLLFAVIEITARVYEGIKAAKYPVLYEYDQTLGWKHIPGLEGTFMRRDGVAVPVNFNSVGFRGPEIGAEDDAGTRVVFIGDSHTAGLYVTEELTFIRRTEKILNDGGGNYEFLNAGVSGYSTDQELLYLEKELMELDPEVVVMVFCMNDLLGNVSGFSSKPKPHFELSEGELVLKGEPVITEEELGRREYERGGAAEKIKYILKTKSAAFRILGTLVKSRPELGKKFARIGAIEVNNNMRKYSLFMKEYGGKLAGSPELTEQLILKIRDTAEEGGADFMVVMVAESVQVYDSLKQDLIDQAARNGVSEDQLDFDVVNRWMSEFCERNSIKFVDLLPAFQDAAKKTEEFLYVEGDPHWNEKGHEVAAKELAGAFKH